MKKIQLKLALLALVLSLTACGGSEMTDSQVTRNLEVVQTEANISSDKAQDNHQHRVFFCLWESYRKRCFRSNH